MKYNILKNIPDLYKKKDRNLYIADSKSGHRRFVSETKPTSAVNESGTEIIKPIGSENQ